MAYSNTWSTATPTESNQANALALYDRQTRLNVQERINSIIGVPIATAFADPIIGAGLSLTELLTAITAEVALTAPYRAVINQELTINSTAGHFYPTTYSRPVGIGTFLTIAQATHGSPNSVIFDLSSLPVGAILVDITLGWQAPATSTMTMAFRKTLLTTGANSPIVATAAIAGTAVFVNTVLATTEVITTNFGYSIEVLATLAAADSMLLGAIKVRYTTANANIRR